VTYREQVSDIAATVVAAQQAIRDLDGVVIEHPTPELSEEEYDRRVTDTGLRQATRTLYLDEHYRSAILEAYKHINNLVKELSKRTELDGAPLMNSVFSAATPRLAVNGLSNKSETDEQQGYMLILAGAMTGIRNPRAHETAWPDNQERALELLTFAQHLVTRIRNCTVKRTKGASKANTKSGRP
jgi:uncharacterized protein (TIGR02391 family)